MQILHGNFTSAFSLVYCGKFNYEKPSLIMKVSQTSSLWIFLFLGNVHAHGFGSMAHFLTLAGWQVWSSCEVPQGTSGYHHRCLNVDIFINSIWNSHPLCIWYCRILHIFELNTLFWVFEYFFILETSSRRYREQTTSTGHFFKLLRKFSNLLLSYLDSAWKWILARCTWNNPFTAKTLVLNLIPPVLWEDHTKLVIILTPVGVSLIPLSVKFNTGGC